MDIAYRTHTGGVAVESACTVGTSFAHCQTNRNHWQFSMIHLAESTIPSSNIGTAIHFETSICTANSYQKFRSTSFHCQDIKQAG